MVLCQDTDQGTGTLCSHCCRDQTAPGVEMFPLGHVQLLEMTLGLVERPSANIGEAGSTLRHGGISLSTSAQKTIGFSEWIHFFKIKHQPLSMVWQQPRGREQVDAPSPGNDSPVL